jgi:uracil-DNA glycosylase
MSNWEEALRYEHSQPYYKDLFDFVMHEYDSKTIYPPKDKIMNATNLTPLDNVRCVILGQDPYHEPNEAMGLAFSVNVGVTIPPSLQNIYKELQSEYGYPIPNNGDLSHWAKQGVLLLNSVLTVQAHKANSHSGHGWEQYTDAILSIVNQQNRPIVYMLWGAPARRKKPLLTNPNHLVLETSHPSPLSVYRGFEGCGHFKKCNDFLVSHNLPPIDWQIPDV